MRQEFSENNLKCTLPDIVKELDLKVNKSTVSRSLRCLKFEYKRLPKNFQLTRTSYISNAAYSNINLLSF